MKARHLGKGMVQDLSPEMDFEEMILVDGRLVLDPNPIGRHDHIEEGERKIGREAVDSPANGQIDSAVASNGVQ